ncbi:AAA family ATPase [Actinomadura roseirufa]|uniref:AAA family ATPase n=1 Tax=Actinomadura roseirufa TaxID=2094049 RepID=UPI0013F15CB0|nr:AAA family ATPase [Actinomadura roseirufa]
MTVLRNMYEEASSGNGGSLLVNGGMASGKTTLLHDFLRHCGERGAATFSATGARSESDLPGGVIEQLVRGGDLLPAETGRAASHGADLPLVRTTCGALLALSRDRPVVIGVDDVQFADSRSLLALLYLHRRIRTARVLLVLNFWERPRPTLSDFCAELTRRPYHRLRLAPMSRAAVTDLAARSMDAGAAARLAPELLERSAGNPMLASALIEDHLAGAAGGGAHVGRAVLDALHRWGPQVLEVGRALAVLGEHATAELAARLLRARPEGVAEIMEILTGAGLLAAGRLRHEPVRRAVLSDLSTPERAWLDIRAADLLHRRGAAATAVAGHLLAAGRAAGPWSVDVLREAARAALADDLPGRAERFLELAMTACDDPAGRAEIGATLAEATWRVAPATADAYLSESVTDHDAATVIRHALWRGDRAAVSGALDRLAGGPPDHRLAAELRLALHWYYGTAAREHAPGDDPWNQAADALTTLWARGGHRAATASAEHVLRSCALGDGTLEVLATALLALAHGGEGDRAARWCDHLVAEAARRRGALWQAVLGSVRAEITLWLGDPAGAHAEASRALELLPPREWGVLIGYPLTCLLLAGAALGRPEPPRHPVPDAMLGTVLGARYLHARGRSHLATDRVLAAVTDFQACRRLIREHGLDVRALVPVEHDLAEANLRLGRRGTARELAVAQLRAARGPRLRGMSLRVLAACSDPSQRPALLREAVAHLERSGDRLELARAHRALSETGSAKTADPVLSDAEHRVVVLAATGHSNREISRKLWITVSTVEQHLTRAYRKLGVSGRSELEEGLAERGVSLASEEGELSVTANGA